MRKILFLEWESMGNDFAKQAFEEQGFAVELHPFERKQEDTSKSPRLAEALINKLFSDAYEFVFSFNYFPIAAMACKACKVKYVSWTYDSPFVQLYDQSITFETNYAFVFDRKTCWDLWNRGVHTVYYLPMAAGVSYYDNLIPTEAQREQYDSDVAMVGSMYTDQKHNLWYHLEGIDDYTRGYLDSLIQAQKRIYGANVLEQALTESVMKAVQKVCPVYARPEGMETAEWTFANYFLARQVTALERREILELLQEECRVQLFTREETPELTKVKNRGRVDYYHQAPLVYKCGKIHLNISLRSIQTGIPQRAFDIMGCGGFLLSNFQSDFLDFFVPGEDLVLYESYQDLLDKVHYYLEHEEERRAIARRGYEKVKAHHTYRHRIQEMLEVLGLV